MSWDDLRLFLAAWEAGTLTAAAATLGVGQATVSRRLAALEAELGQRLFTRHRGGLVPSDAARALHPHVAAMAASARDAGAALQDLAHAPRGTVRIACPPGFAVDLLPGLLPILRRRHPELRIEILSDNLYVDLGRHQADIALRGAPPEDGDMVFRRMADVPLSVFASTTLLGRLPADPGPADLEWCTWSEDLAHIPMARYVADLLDGRPPAMTTNSFLAMRAAARAGVGCMVLPVPQGLLAGLRQVPVALPPLPAAPFYMVIPGGLRQVPRVAVVADFLVEVLARVGQLEGDVLSTWPPPDLGG